MRVLRTLMPRKARHPVSYKLKRACGAIKSFLIEFSIITTPRHLGAVTRERTDLMLYSILFSGGRVNFLEIVMHILATLVVITVILPFHELAHGFIAYKLGDDTAKRMGRLTFNPLNHIDPIGALCLLLVGFGWAEPVPVNMRRLKNPKRDMALVALAGPMANLIAALVGAILNDLFVVLLSAHFSEAVWFDAIEFFFEYYVVVNVGLAIFNLIPLPPLDGSKILASFLPDGAYEKFLLNERKLSSILIICIALGIVDKIVAIPESFVLTFIYFLAGLPFRLFI